MASRRDRFGPLASIIVEDAGSDGIAGFQLVSPEDQSEFFDVYLIAKTDQADYQKKIGQVPLAMNIPFSFAISASGLATLNVGALATNIEFTQIQSGTAKALCTSGQFRFDQLVFE